MQGLPEMGLEIFSAPLVSLALSTSDLGPNRDLQLGMAETGNAKEW